MSLEEKVALEVKRRGIKLTALAKATGMQYQVIQTSFKGRRQLRADEFFTICDFLDADPNIFRPSDIA